MTVPEIPVGITIDVVSRGGRRRTKFIGKVIDVGEEAPEWLAGRRVFYREGDFRDLVTYATATERTGGDKNAFDLAYHYGAEIVYIQIQDRDARALVASMEKVINSPAWDMGERKQYRLPVSEWRQWRGHFHAPRTDNLIDADQGLAEFRPPDEAEQLRLFDV